MLHDAVSVSHYCIFELMTYALPMTPHASFATDPFSFSREKKPGLCTDETHIASARVATYIPNSFFDFKYVVAFII